MRKSRIAVLASAGAASLAASMIVPGLARAASEETYASISCTTSSSLKNEGYYFAYSAHGNDYPGGTRIEVEFYRSSSSQGSGTDENTGETTTSSSGTWSTSTYYDAGVGISGGDEQVRVQVVEASNGAYLGSSSIASIPYNDCSPINYSPKA
jgi:hypothetical protein